MAIQKKSLLIFFIMLLIPCILIKTYRKLTLNNRSLAQSFNTPPVPENQWLTWLQEQEKEVWDELTSTTHLTSEHCNHLKNEWYQDYKMGEAELHKAETKPTPLSKKTHDTINAILNEFGLSTKELPLAAWKDRSAAGTTDSKLLINEYAFNKLSDEAKKFVIGHEVQHFLHKDTSTRYVVERFSKTGKDLPQDHPLNKLYRFQEVRADIQAALKGPDYMQGYISFVEQLSKKGENKGITHPKNSLRLSMGKKLLNNLSML